MGEGINFNYVSSGFRVSKAATHKTIASRIQTQVMLLINFLTGLLSLIIIISSMQIRQFKRILIQYTHTALNPSLLNFVLANCHQNKQYSTISSTLKGYLDFSGSLVHDCSSLRYILKERSLWYKALMKDLFSDLHL